MCNLYSITTKSGGHHRTFSSVEPLKRGEAAGVIADARRQDDAVFLLHRDIGAFGEHGVEMLSATSPIGRGGIALGDPGKGLRPIDRPEPLTPTLSLSKSDISEFDRFETPNSGKPELGGGSPLR